MKKLLFVFLLTPFMLQAQDNEEIQKKLKSYKTMYEDSLINLEEYIKLKQFILFPAAPEKPFMTEAQTDEKYEQRKAALSKYKNNYIANFTVGSLLLGGGIGCITTGLYIRINNYPDPSVYSNQADYRSQFDFQRKRFIAFVTAGSGLSIGGIIMLAFGGYNRNLYIDKKKQKYVSMSTHDIGLCFNF